MASLSVASREAPRLRLLGSARSTKEYGYVFRVAVPLFGTHREVEAELRVDRNDDNTFTVGLLRLKGMVIQSKSLYPSADDVLQV